MAEILDIVDSEDRVIGSALREDVHGNPDLFHRVAHVLVFNSSGDLYLQKRSIHKDLQPGKWDTSVGGHVDSGENYTEAALRETAEELGIAVDPEDFEFLYKYMHSNSHETEWVSTYRLVWDGGIKLQESEIDDGRFWRIDEIKAAGRELFTPNFLDEFYRFLRQGRL